MSIKLKHTEVLRFVPNFDELPVAEQIATLERLENDPEVRNTLHQEIDDAYEKVRVNPNATIKEVVAVSIAKIMGEWRFGL